MARQTSASQLEAKLEEAKRLEAEIRQLKNAARDKKKAEDEQRNKILGRVIQAAIAEEPDGELAQSIHRLLAGKLTKASERSLFPELPVSASTPQMQKAAEAELQPGLENGDTRLFTSGNEVVVEGG